ncbi:sensor histidine kinase [Paenibacillus radicis (ex Gao et al. 2016)]|uniref:Histidine kinase n=1 Tax=Paenibacillus radicis (ex Gao et al. 2016) TaxID=1737354 RepID=A0A917GYM5_9BACL|nr:sensor histidine kinase [Paenibacillus radicis (ex Gao et al. 2016)]GGG61457.1 histidine kinase [Paenibacillus radicis (ex Gao et al. 2016)]
MRRLLDRFKYNGLFVKMFIIMVASIVAVSILVTWTTINVSERVFMETFSITNSKVIEQINSRIDSFNYSIVLTTNKIAQSGTIRQFLTENGGTSSEMNQAFYRMGQQMNRIKSGMDVYEVGITVTGINGRSYATVDRTYWPVPDKELKDHPITKKALEQPTKLMYFYDDAKRSGKPYMEPTIIAAKTLLDRSGKAYGIVYFAIRERDFSQFYDVNTSQASDAIVLDKDGLIISANRKEWIGETSKELLTDVEQIEERSLDYKNAHLMGKDQIVLSEYLAPLDLYMVNLIDKNAAIGQLTDTKRILLIVMAIVAVAVIIVFIISRRLTKSLTRLVKQISNISKYEFDRHVTIGGSYETKQLGIAFNAMIDELNDYVGELVETQKQRRNAELEALQQQINPHFLYNTLASVKFMVQQGSKDKAAETINALISLLHNAIGNISETITVSQELDNMKNYVFINQIRYGERIRVSYFIAPDCLDYHVPKLMIQPFIENAFFHAFNIKPEGHIYIMIGQDGDALMCEVVDNGDGMELSRGSKLPNSSSKRQLFSGIGVRNVNDRIKLLYGESYGVTISSELGEGTRIKIRIPLLKI